MKQSQDCRGRFYSDGGLKRGGVKVRTAVTSEARTGVLGAWLKGDKPFRGWKTIRRSQSAEDRGGVDSRRD